MKQNQNKTVAHGRAGRKHLQADAKGFTVHPAEVWNGDEEKDGGTAPWNLFAVESAPSDLPRVLFLSGNDCHYERRRLARRCLHGGSFFLPQMETFTQQEAIGRDHKECGRRPPE